MMLDAVPRYCPEVRCRDLWTVPIAGQERQAGGAGQAGVFAEPAAAACAAALLTEEARDRLDPGRQIVLLVTGHGLKDVEAPLSRIHIPEAIPADIAALLEEPAER
jgi:threonine synthase